MAGPDPQGQAPEGQRFGPRSRRGAACLHRHTPRRRRRRRPQSTRRARGRGGPGDSEPGPRSGGSPIRVQPRRALLGHFGSSICGAGGTATAPLPRQHQSAGHGRGGPNSDRAAPPRPSTTATVAQPAFALSFALSALRVKTGLRACLDRPSGLSRSRPNKRL